MAIDIPVNAPGADASAKSIAHLRDEVGGLRKIVESSAPSVESLSKRLGDAARNFNEVTTAASKLGNGIVAAAKFLSDGSAAIESHERALSSLHGAYSAVAQATNDSVTAEQAARVEAQFTTAQLHVTDDQLAAVTKSAREMAIVTGTDTSQALEQLTQALISGEKDGLRKFGISVGDAKDKNEAFANGLGDLVKKMDAVPTSAQTAAEQMRSLNDVWGLFVATIGDSIAKMVGFHSTAEMVKDGITGLKYLLGGDKQLGESVASDIQQTGALGRRIAVGQRAKDAGINLHGIAMAQGEEAINAQSVQIERIMTLRGQAVAAALHGQRAQFEALESEAELSTRQLRGDATTKQYDVSGIQTAERGPGYKTLGQLLEESGINRPDTRRRRGGHSGGSAAGGIDPAQLTEMMQTMGILRGELSGSMHDVSGLGQGGGEDTKTYLARAAGALEDVFVDANHRAIRRRGESEIEFAKRRIDLAKSTAETILAEEKRKHEQGLKDEEKALEDARKLTIARQDMKLEAAARRVTLAGAARARSESGGILTSEEAGVGSERSALEEQKQLLQTRHDDLDIRIALESSEERQLALVREKIGVEEQLYGIKSKTRDMEQADRDKQLKNDFGRQLAGKFVADAKNIQTSAQTSADIFKSTSDSVVSGLANQTLAVIQNKKSAGQALRDGLTDLAAATFPRALMEGGLALAGGFAQAAIGNEPGAAMLFAAAAQYGVVAALAGGGAALLAATAPSAASAGGGAAQAARGGSSSLGRTPSANNADNGGGNVFNMYYSGAPMMTAPELHRATQQMIGEAMANAPMHAGTSRALRGELGAR